MGTRSPDDTTAPVELSPKREEYDRRQRAFHDVVSALRDEIVTSESSLEAEESSLEAEDPHSIRKDLTRAQVAVENEEYPEALANYYRAERAWFERSKGPGAREKVDRELYGRAKSVVTSSRKFVPIQDRTAITEHLTDETGAVKRHVDTSELILAMEALHNYTVKRYETVESVRAHLRIGIAGLLLSIVGFFVFIDPSPLSALLNTGTGSLARAGPFTPLAVPAEFPVSTLQITPAPVDHLELAFVTVIGIVGAGFSTVYQAYRNPNEMETPDPRFPSPSFGWEGTFSRFLVGIVSAILLYSILMSTVTEGVLDVRLRDDRWAIVLLAFTAGYSERVLDRTLSRLEERFSV